MADSPSSRATLDPNVRKPEPDNPTFQPDPPSPPPPHQQQQQPSTLNPNSTLVSPLPTPISSYASPPISGPIAAVPPAQPSFCPVPQFSLVPNPNYPNHSVPTPGVQPPGVSSAPMMAPGASSGGFAVAPVSVPPHMMPYQVPPGQAPNLALRPYVPMPNGYAAIPGTAPQGTMLPPVS